MEKLRLILLNGLAVLMLMGCSNDEDIEVELPPETADTARYKVTFISKWTQETHPNEFPSGAHFSGIVGMCHSSQVSLFEENKLASKGIESMAETGGQNSLISEINDFISQELAFSYIKGSGISYSGQTSEEFLATKDFPLFSVTSMIAPSPDWFVAVQNVDLMENGDWKENFEVEVIPYDAGTEEGTKFSFSNSETDPKENIKQITSGILMFDGKIESMGTMKFELINQEL